MVFWLLAALFAVAALAFVLPALLARGRRTESAIVDATNVAVYRDQFNELEADLAAGTLGLTQVEEARREIERRMLEDVRSKDIAAPAAPSGRGTVIAVGIAIPLAAALLYLAVGNPQALTPVPTADAGGHAVTLQQIEGMVDRLAARMKETPDDVKGWAMLGRSYSVLDRFPEAVIAYENAVRRSPPDAQLLADYADALAMTQGRTLMGAPETIIAQALQADPNNVKALALAGTVALQKKDFKVAIAHWERALKVVAPESDMADAIRDSIADARKFSGDGADSDAAPRTASAPGSVSGTVSLAPALVAKAGPDDTVFIFARPVQGPRMPLAVMRKRVRDLPAAFRLDDSMAMTPASKLSNHPQVVVGARVSKSGSPVAQPGDLEGLAAPVKVGDSRVTVTINTVVR